MPVEWPGTVPAEWHGRNSELYYCENGGMQRVRYSWGVMHDHADSLVVISAEEAALSPREKVVRFPGEEALRNYDRATGVSLPRANAEAR